MKPDWDKLGTEHKDSSSVLIADVDCTVETDLCGEKEVRGYPTIMYYTAETGRDGEKYQGGRDFDSLSKFVEDNLSRGCDITDLSTCDEKEQKFHAKMKDKSADEIAKEKARLEGMKEGKMKAPQKKWLVQRLNVLNQM